MTNVLFKFGNLFQTQKLSNKISPKRRLRCASHTERLARLSFIIQPSAFIRNCLCNKIQPTSWKINKLVKSNQLRDSSIPQLDEFADFGSFERQMRLICFSYLGKKKICLTVCKPLVCPPPFRLFALFCFFSFCRLFIIVLVSICLPVVHQTRT